MATVENIISPLEEPISHLRVLKKKSESTQHQTFEETYKTSYSHGLEHIYAIETIDIRSVRRLETTPISAPKQEIPAYIAPKRDKSAQITFDFGHPFTGTVDSFILKEPIQVLALSKHAEKFLLDNEKTLIQDLIGVNLNQYIFKGIGQGHLDEIQNKLNEYLEKRELYECETVDFAAWMRSLTFAFDRKKCAPALQSFHLEQLLSLTAVDTLEIGRLSEEKKALYHKEMLSYLRNDDRKHAFLRDMGLIIDAYVKPWMEKRLGLATKEELIERLLRISDDPSLTERILDFFSVVYFDGQLPFASYLHEVEEGLYCIDSTTTYQHVINRALSYFYSPTVHYSLSHLVSLLQRECAQQWLSFPEGFLDKVLTHSSFFRVRKTADLGLTIRLS